MEKKHPLDIAADALGGAAQLGIICDVTPQAISNWKRRGVPIDRCLAIEYATKGAVTRRDLRDDWRSIWPELAKKQPAQA